MKKQLQESWATRLALTLVLAVGATGGIALGFWLLTQFFYWYEGRVIL